MADEEKKFEETAEEVHEATVDDVAEKTTVIDDKARAEEAESLCKWAAARAGVIVVAPGLGTLSLTANDFYMIKKLGDTYDHPMTEKAIVKLLGAMGAVFLGGRLSTLIPFAPMQIPIAIATTYGLGRVVTQWLQDGCPDDLSAFKKVYDDAVKDAKEHIDTFKNFKKKDEPLGDETKKYDV